MLMCSGCCSEGLQRRSPEDGLGKSRIRHKDICRVLSKFCEVVKDCMAPDSCSAELVAFLQP
jgi:hypothetical protein